MATDPQTEVDLGYGSEFTGEQIDRAVKNSVQTEGGGEISLSDVLKALTGTGEKVRIEIDEDAFGDGSGEAITLPGGGQIKLDKAIFGEGPYVIEIDDK